MFDLILKFSDHPDKIGNFTKGKFELIQLGQMKIGKASYEAGWKWSKHASPKDNLEFCENENYGIVLSRSATVVFKDKKIHILKKGDLFFVLNVAYYSWVLGNEKYISLHFLGAENYTNQ